MCLHLDATAALSIAGWVRGEPTRSASAPVPQPLVGVCDQLIVWASSFSVLASSDDQVWFLSAENYAGGVGVSDEAFPWNAFRHESLAVASGPAERAAINAFWSTHLPILLSVRNGYEYLALAPDGQVVRGGEPEFEEVTVVATDFEALLRGIAAGVSTADPFTDALLGTVGTARPGSDR
ncbi:hypothetical protein GEO20_28075 [Rhodococcus erythropolis]|uniref:hypothetical protein n=1 Tax=Rhodococcus erythropolis TaxID=1833 RepID=UPI00129173EB|nr:hypothetical protein [Rhodococcus erythropolis]MQP35807.1 hypothetical protein [Rhodococcus erythropolis]